MQKWNFITYWPSYHSFQITCLFYPAKHKRRYLKDCLSCSFPLWNLPATFPIHSFCDWKQKSYFWFSGKLLLENVKFAVRVSSSCKSNQCIIHICKEGMWVAPLTYTARIGWFSNTRWEEDEITVMHRKLDSVEPVMVRLCVWPVWVSALTWSDFEQHDERAQDPITQLTPESCSLMRRELPSLCVFTNPS